MQMLMIFERNMIKKSMRKLMHFVYGVVKSGKPFDSSYGASMHDFQDGIRPRFVKLMESDPIYECLDGCAGRLSS